MWINSPFGNIAMDVILDGSMAMFAI